MLTLDQRAEISELLEDGLSFREVARRTGCDKRTIGRFAFEIDDEATAYLPSPDEIAAKCEEIRSRWSDEEREERRVGRGLQPVETQQIDTEELMAAFADQMGRRYSKNRNPRHK